MDRTQTIAAIIAGGQYGTGDADKAWLNQLPDDRLAQLAKAPQPLANAAGCGCGGTGTTAPAQPAAPAVTVPAAAAAPVVANAQAPAAPVTMDQWLGQLPPEGQMVIRDALAIQAAERGRLAQTIIANSKGTFTQEMVARMPFEQLRATAQLCSQPAQPAVPNYLGAGGYFPTPTAPVAQPSYQPQYLGNAAQQPVAQPPVQQQPAGAAPATQPLANTQRRVTSLPLPSTLGN